MKRLFVGLVVCVTLAGCGSGNSNGTNAVNSSSSNSGGVSVQVTTNTALTNVWTSTAELWSTDLVVDSSGNSYVANSLSNTLQKYDPSGTLQWAKSVNVGTTTDASITVSLDASGNVYTVNYVNSTTAGQLQKFNSSGVVQWAIPVGTNPICGPIDSNGNIYVTNWNGSSTNQLLKINSAGVLQWAVPTVSTSNIAIAGAVDSSNNIYVINALSLQKFDTTGTLLWTTTVGDSYNIGSIAVAVDSSGNSYAINNAVYYTAHGIEVEYGTLTKVSPVGAVLWTATTGIGPTSVAVDSSNNIYVAYTENSGGIDKFSSTGSSLWTFTTAYSPYGISLDDVGNIYITEAECNQSNGQTNGQILKYSQN